MKLVTLEHIREFLLIDLHNTTDLHLRALVAHDEKVMKTKVESMLMRMVAGGENPDVIFDNEFRARVGKCIAEQALMELGERYCKIIDGKERAA